MEILNIVLDKIREDNPYGLVLKGGTSLTFHHVPGHRESEDLDFDLDSCYRDRAEEIANYLKGLLQDLLEDGEIKEFHISKQGMSSTDRYHMNITIETYKRFQTKIDLDFVTLPEKLEYQGKLGFYTAERMLVAKMLTFTSRREFKDLYDVAHLLRKVEPASFPEPEKLAKLMDEVLQICEDDTLIRSYKKAFRNIDLRFKNLKESQVRTFIEKTKRQLRTFRNQLKKKG